MYRAISGCRAGYYPYRQHQSPQVRHLKYSGGQFWHYDKHPLFPDHHLAPSGWHLAPSGWHLAPSGWQLNPQAGRVQSAQLAQGWCVTFDKTSEVSSAPSQIVVARRSCLAAFFFLAWCYTTPRLAGTRHVHRGGRSSAPRLWQCTDA